MDGASAALLVRQRSSSLTPKGVAAGAERGRRAGRQLGRDLPRLLLQLLVVHDAGHEAHRAGAVRLDALVEEHQLGRPPPAHDPRQRPRGAAVGREADLRIGHREARGLLRRLTMSAVIARLIPAPAAAPRPTAVDG